MSTQTYSSVITNAQVLVLGGTSGIGFCVAEHALSQGAIVTISSSRQSKLDSALNRLKASLPERAANVYGHVCDLSNVESTRLNLGELLKYVTRKQPLDHIVFTAGDGIQIRPVSELEVETIQRLGNLSKTSSITLTSGLNCTKPGERWTTVAGWGAGTEGLARGLAVDLAPIRVNTVSPGAVHTELFDDFGGDRLEEILTSFREQTLTDSVGTPQELSEAYIYLMRCSFATGSLIEVNGGALLK